ncbi:MAG: APC family permease, partial [Nocardioidaceae bacterium]
MAVDTSPPPARRAGSASLKREIGLIGLLWASVGSIIGSGWLFGAQRALVAAGPAAIISWVIGGIAILLLGLVHAELGAMYPLSGGSARFPHYAFGGIAGAGFGWFSWLQAVTVAPIEVSAMIGYLTHWSFAKHWLKPDQTLTHTGLVVAILIMAVMTVVNFAGVKVLAQTNSAMTWWKVAVPIFAMLVVVFHGLHGSNFHAANGFSPDGAHGILLAVAGSGIIFSYLGFEQADQLAGESANPKRDIPFAVIGSIVIGLIIYLALQVVFLLALPASAIGTTWNSTAGHAFGNFTGPWADLAGVIGLGWLSTLLRIDAVISPGGTGLIYLAAGSRVSYGLARNKYFNSVFELLNSGRVPWVGVLTSFIAGCVCFLPFPSWQSLVGLITSASVLMYAGAPLSLGAFRKRLPNAERPWALPGSSVISPLAFIVASLIIVWTGWDIDKKLGILIILGCLLIFNREFKPGHMRWQSAVWLPVYLIGLGVIVYISDFGPTKV